MRKLNNKELRQLILKEIIKMKEDTVLPKHDQGHVFKTRKMMNCGSCGYSMKEDESVCEQCGTKAYEEEEEEVLKEGDCGCGSSVAYSPGSYQILDYDSDDDFIPDHMHHSHDEDILTPGEAFGIGISIGNHDHDFKIGNHKIFKGSYMAKNHMYKTAKYAAKLYQMIPDGHNLEDWMRSKLAQIADDISEVYHALDHDIFEGDV